jgi:hypothetical protein
MAGDLYGSQDGIKTGGKHRTARRKDILDLDLRRRRRNGRAARLLNRTGRKGLE